MTWIINIRNRVVASLHFLLILKVWWGTSFYASKSNKLDERDTSLKDTTNYKSPIRKRYPNCSFCTKEFNLWLKPFHEENFEKKKKLKTSSPHDFISEFYQTFKKEVILLYTNAFWTLERWNCFSASITLTPKLKTL